MVNAGQAGYVVPNVRIPKVVGILNIVFAANILVCGLCSGMYVAILPAMLKATVSMQKNMEKVAEDQKKADLEKLDEAEKAAKTDQEKADIEAQRQEIRSRPKPTFAGASDANALALGDPTFNVYMWIDLLSGLALNLMMLAAGIALVNRKPSGITLGIWTAGLKIVRLVALYSIYAIVVVPTLAKAMGKIAMQQMEAQATGGPMPAQIDMSFLVRTYTIMGTVTALGMILFGAIYPAVSLWLLTRPGARAACSGMKLPDEGPDAW